MSWENSHSHINSFHPLHNTLVRILPFPVHGWGIWDRQELNERAQGQTSLKQLSWASKPGLLISYPRLFALHHCIPTTTHPIFYRQDMSCSDTRTSPHFHIMMGFTLLYLGFCCFLVPIPRNIQPKNEGNLSLNSLVGEKKKWFSVPFLDSLIRVETRHSLGSWQLLSSVCFIPSHTP